MDSVAASLVVAYQQAVQTTISIPQATLAWLHISRQPAQVVHDLTLT
jgi:hypothetical protein